SLDPGLSKICHRSIPILGLDCVVRQSLDLWRRVGEKRFDTFDGPRVKRAPGFREKAIVSDVPCEDVLERVLGLEAESRLVEKLALLQDDQYLEKEVLRSADHFAQQRQGHVLANDGGGGQDALLFRLKSIKTGAQHVLNRVGYPRRNRRAALFQNG